MDRVRYLLDVRGSPTTPPNALMCVHNHLPAVLIGLALLCPTPTTGRQVESRNPVEATPAAVRMEGFTRRQALKEASLVKNIPFRSVGPAIMSGRVADLDVSESDPTHFYVAYASGGLWKTTSNGSAFTPLFDDQIVMTIGDIAVDWEHGETLWVGTGEKNSSRSSYAGAGVFRSGDGGETWEALGLAETHHISRIVLHPEDPETVWVAALGHLYSPNPERGVFKTTDGGRSWTKTLFIDEDTGVVDLVMDPSNPSTLYAAAWHRTRRAWNFVESGATSGIYKSTDGGESWTLISTPESGLPQGDGVGRIGLAVYPGDPKILFALIDNQDRREETPDEDPELTARQFRGMDRETFLALDTVRVEAYLRAQDFPKDVTARSVAARIRRGELEPAALAEYVEDAESALYTTDVVGGELYRSNDGGDTWARTHAGPIDDFYNTYGYYFGEVRVAPDDPERVYLLGVPLLRSDDGGRTFANIDRDNVHGDHQALWLNPRRSGHLLLGNDGGLNLSYDDGASWFKLNTPAVGQFYGIAVDMAEPYNVYGGLQDNGVWMGPSTYEAGLGWHDSGRYPYKRLLGGDGMQVQVDTRSNQLVYTGSQFGYYYRVDTQKGDQNRARPRHKLGERPPRFNWQTPIHLSRHNQDILYLGSHLLHRSMDRGETFEPISGDLTRGMRPGDVPFGSLTTLDESPLRFGMLYAGSDDGLVHLSRDGGASWTRISDGLPADLWVSRVRASAFEEGTVYVTLNGYRWDHFDAYLYRSTDYGATWTRLGSDLPPEPLNVMVEDPWNPEVLYVGSDHGVYCSLDGGATFMALDGGLPDAPVHDLVVQKRERELVVGTHGRSIYIGDVSLVERLTDSLRAVPLHLFALDPVRFNDRWGRRSGAWRDPVEPKVNLAVAAAAAGEARVRVRTGGGETIAEWSASVSRGLSFLSYDLAADSALVAERDRRQARGRRRAEPEPAPVAGKPARDTGKRYLLPGTYLVEVASNGATATGELVVEPKSRNRGRE